MKKATFFLIFITVIMSSCATVLNTKYQGVSIDTKKTDQVFIDEKKGELKKGKYLFKRDYQPKQITIVTEKAKDRNIVIMQYKKSPLHILSWVPFGILIYPPIFDIGAKSWDYAKDVEIPKKTYSVLDRKRDEMKEVAVNKVSVMLEKNDIKYSYFSNYKAYLRKHESWTDSIVYNDEKVEIENSIFSIALNELFKEKGYIDTTNIALKSSYINNLFINATIKDFTMHNVSNRYSSLMQNLGSFGSMVFVDLSIDWEILDLYKNTIYTQSTAITSGQFAVIDDEKREKAFHKAIKDGLEMGLLELMNSKNVQRLLVDRSQIEIENSFEEIKIPTADTYVSSLSESVNSSVTIKTKYGFGSGFIISDNGYIISNYHVVSDTNMLEVILNDETKYTADIVRVSKIYDLALIKIEAKNLVPMEISKTKNIQVAEEIYAIGTSTAVDLSQTLSKGIVSAIRKLENDSKLIQTDASINSGNSGGALILNTGQVIGVISSKMKGYGIEGVAFGIPAYEIIDRLKIQFE